MTILWGVVVAFILPDSPLQENFMKGKEKYIALDRVKRNMTGIENRVSPTYHRGQTFL
jgi:ACS family allantoate permease-like MFS transporter